MTRLAIHRAISVETRFEELPDRGEYQSGQLGQTVNLLSYDFAGSNPASPTACGCSSMVEQQPSKLKTRVRFPSPALKAIGA
jgi:hypothetical protein